MLRHIQCQYGRGTKFLNNVNEINQPIIGNNNYISISKHLTALINPYKELRRKFYLGFITVALLICSLFLDNPFNKDLETRRYYSNRDKIFHKYLKQLIQFESMNYNLNYLFITVT